MKSSHKNQIRRGDGIRSDDELQIPHIGLDDVPPLTIEELSDTYSRMVDAGWEPAIARGRFILLALEREFEILKEDAKRPALGE